jgi:hypothetical protein
MAQKAAQKDVTPADQATEDKLKVVKDLRGSTTATDTQTLAKNVTNMWDVLQIVRGGAPAAGTPERKIYDQALSSLGGASKSADVAAKALDESIALSIKNLDAIVKSKADVGSYGLKLSAMLGKILDGVGDPEQLDTYRTYSGVSDAVSNLRINCMRAQPAAEETQAAAEGEKAPAPKMATSTATMSAPLRTMPPLVYDVGRIHLLNATGDVKTYAVGGSLSTLQLKSFNGDSNAANAFVGTYANALASWWDNRTVDCPALLKALGGVSDSIKLDPNYATAVSLLQAGKGQEALQALGKISALRSVLDISNNITIVKMSPRAVSIFTGEATVVLDLFGDRSEYERYLSRPGSDAFGRAFVELAVKAAVDILRASGKVTTGSIDMANMRFAESSSKQVTFNGLAASVTPQLGLSTSAGSRPLKIIAHATFGYRQFESAEPLTVMQQDGTTKQEPFKRQEGYLGLWGMEFQFPPRGGDVGVVRVERVGAGVVGTEMRNALGYITFSVNPKSKDDTVRHQLLFTPTYAGFMQQASQFEESKYMARPGLEVGYNWMKDTSKGLITLGPTARVDYNFMTNVATVDGNFQLSYRFLPQWEAYGRMGYLAEVGGKEYDRLPTNVGPGTLYGGLGMRWTPGATIPTRREGGASKKVQVSDTRQTSLQRDVSAAYDMIDAGTDTSAKGIELAKELSGRIEGQLVMSGQSGNFASNKDYQAGIKALRDGNLKDGLDSLAKVPGLGFGR